MEPVERAFTMQLSEGWKANGGSFRAEVAGMRKDELRLEAATRSVQGERSKNDEQHIVPLSPLALDLIRKALALQSEERISPYVFPSRRDPEASIAPNALTHAPRKSIRPRAAPPPPDHGDGDHQTPSP